MTPKPCPRPPAVRAMADLNLLATRIKLFLATLVISGGFALLLLGTFNFIGIPYLPLGLCGAGLMLIGYFWLDLELWEIRGGC